MTEPEGRNSGEKRKMTPINQTSYFIWFAIILMAYMGISLATAGEGGDGPDEIEEPTGPVIRADNISQLEPFAQIDFATAPDRAGSFLTGVFEISPDGRYLTTFNTDADVVTWNDAGDVISVMSGPGDAYDATFSPASDAIIAVYSDGEIITFRRNPFESAEIEEFEYLTRAQPQELWMSDDESLWFEIVTLENETDIINLPFDRSIDLTRLPYGPATDPDAIVRVGRIPPPFAITATGESEVSRWDLETATVTAEAQVENGPPVFGQISPDGRYFAWRDPQSNFLNRLDFQTGENVVVAPLEGQYVQGYFISPDGSIILGVDVDFEPVVVAWVVETGERIDLGTYRVCSRVPDMIRMSHDATTLAIGCDTGLELWRIASAPPDDDE
ncbi:MAG: hypothetical protein ACOCXZ_01510 [Chloroflexota bacterium]